MDSSEYHKIYSEIKKQSEIKECFYHNKNECLGKIKNAHSISRSGRLDLIKGLVNKNEKVYSLSEISISENNISKSVKAIGWGQAASTFFGFCDDHDTKIFLPIENDNEFNNSIEHCFLHSYRSFAYSYHLLRKTYKMAENVVKDPKLQELLEALNDLLIKLKPLKEELSMLPEAFPIPIDVINKIQKLFTESLNNSNLNTNPKTQTILASIISKTNNISTLKDVLDFFNEIGSLKETLESELHEFNNILSYSKEELKDKGLHSWMVWMEDYKKKIDYAIENKTYDNLKHHVKIKDQLFPFACAFSFSPQFLYDDFLIPKNDPSEIINSCLIITVLPDKSGKTIIILSCFNEDEHSKYYLNKLFSLVDENEFERALTSIIIEHGQNVFINPTMWDAFGELQNTLERERNIQRPFDSLPQKPYMSKLNFFASEYSATALGIK